MIQRVPHPLKNKKSNKPLQKKTAGGAGVTLHDNRPDTVVQQKPKEKIKQRKETSAAGTASLPGDGVAQLAGNAGTHANLHNPASFNAGGLIPAFGNIAPPHIGRTTVNTHLITAANTLHASVMEGATMVAYPISNRTSAGGSTTTDAVRQVSRAASSLYGKRYIAGHLLNNHLGGPGNSLNNITAITSKSNSQHHAGIEKELKQDVHNGFIAHYHVDCSERAGALPNSAGVQRIQGLAKSMAASYSLLRAGGNAANAGDYVPVRYLSLNLDPGGTGQTAQRDGQGIHDAEVLHDKLTQLFTNPASSGQLAAMLKHVASQNMNVQQVVAFFQANINTITSPADRAMVVQHLEEYIRE